MDCPFFESKWFLTSHSRAHFSELFKWKKNLINLQYINPWYFFTLLLSWGTLGTWVSEVEALWAYLIEEEPFSLANESLLTVICRYLWVSRTLTFRSNGALVSILVPYRMSDPRKQWTRTFGTTAKLQWEINAAASLSAFCTFWLLKGLLF